MFGTESVSHRKRCAQNVFCTECVLHRRCLAQNTFRTKCVLAQKIMFFKFLNLAIMTSGTNHGKSWQIRIPDPEVRMWYHRSSSSPGPQPKQVVSREKLIIHHVYPSCVSPIYGPNFRPFYGPSTWNLCRRRQFAPIPHP